MPGHLAPVAPASGNAVAGRRSPAPVLGRVAAWIRRWHGGQLLTFWAGVVVVPWQIGAWRAALVRSRLEGFLHPGQASPGWTGRVSEMLVYVVLPLTALMVTAVWVSGRVRRSPSPRG